MAHELCASTRRVSTFHSLTWPSLRGRCRCCSDEPVTIARKIRANASGVRRQSCCPLRSTNPPGSFHLQTARRARRSGNDQYLDQPVTAVRRRRSFRQARTRPSTLPPCPANVRRSWPVFRSNRSIACEGEARLVDAPHGVTLFRRHRHDVDWECRAARTAQRQIAHRLSGFASHVKARITDRENPFGYEFNRQDGWLLGEPTQQAASFGIPIAARRHPLFHR